MCSTPQTQKNHRDFPVLEILNWYCKLYFEQEYLVICVWFIPLDCLLTVCCSPGFSQPILFTCCVCMFVPQSARFIVDLCFGRVHVLTQEKCLFDPHRGRDGWGRGGTGWSQQLSWQVIFVYPRNSLVKFSFVLPYIWLRLSLRLGHEQQYIVIQKLVYYLHLTWKAAH